MLKSTKQLSPPSRYAQNRSDQNLIYYLISLVCQVQTGERKKETGSIKIIPVFILQVLQLPDPWPDDRPQYYVRSGTVTRHPPEIFVVCHKFFDGRKWAKIIRS